MLTSFVLSMALAAPVPAAPAPVASGPAPRLMELKPNADGKVLFTVIRYDTQKVQIAQGNAVAPGGAAPAVITREVKVPKTETVELGDVKDLTVTTADGKKVDMADAAKKLKEGAVVVVSSDGKPVSPNFLKAFKDDVLVLASPELANTATTVPGVRPPGGIRPLPAPIAAPGLLPAQPGVIQIQIAPGNIQVAPAVPPAAPAPAPPK
jgi:hypothetical protein